MEMFGHTGDAMALQYCIDVAPPFSTVEIPNGRHVLKEQVVVWKPLTLRTAGASDYSYTCAARPQECAILTADPSLADEYGMLLVRNTERVSVRHLVLDGARAARLVSPAAEFCASGQTTPGFNASVLECADCALEDVLSMNALCGTGMAWLGARATIRGNEFRANGDAATPRMWADGLTVLSAADSVVERNRFVDNSDIGLIVGYAVRSRVQANVVVQHAQPAFAGLMLDNFGSNDVRYRGDFREAVVSGNSIDCGAQMCIFGIQVGPRPWYPSKNIIGGELSGNHVRGAKIGINVDGAGVAKAPMAIFDNTVTGIPSNAYFSMCGPAMRTGWMNVSPLSVVDRRDEFEPTGAELSDTCQLTSALAFSPAPVPQGTLQPLR